MLLKHRGIEDDYAIKILGDTNLWPSLPRSFSNDKSRIVVIAYVVLVYVR